MNFKNITVAKYFNTKNKAGHSKNNIKWHCFEIFFKLVLVIGSRCLRKQNRILDILFRIYSKQLTNDFHCFAIRATQKTPTV